MLLRLINVSGSTQVPFAPEIMHKKGTGLPPPVTLKIFLCVGVTNQRKEKLNIVECFKFSTFLSSTFSSFCYSQVVVANDRHPETSSYFSPMIFLYVYL
jgi:hypothetical protein